MKKYLLLRDNQQSGPYSLAEMREMKLVSKDLIWVEDESTCWMYPSEIEELKNHVSCEEKSPGRIIYVSKPRGFTREPINIPEKSHAPSPHDAPVDEASFPAKLPKGIWRSKKLSSLPNLLNVLALSGGLVLGAVMMKKAVDNSEKPIAEEAIPLSVIRDAETNPPVQVQNALLTETIPTKLVTSKPARPAKTKSIRDQVSIKTSDYSVGMLGGISNLQLRLFNNSPRKIDKVTLAIEYLKPNGNVIETDQYEMYSIKPFSASSLSIPDSKRGVKIKYRLVEISAKETREI